MSKVRAFRLAPILLAATLQAAAPAVSAQGVGLAGGPVPVSYPAPASSATVRVDLTGGAAARSIAIPRGKSAIIELPVDARDVLVTNPAVADAVLRSPRRIYVLGMAAGQTDAVFFDGAGRRILSLDIRVDQDVGALEDTIARVLPGSRVRIEAINDSVILTGLVMSPSDADKAAQIAARFVARPEQVLNMLSVAGKDQVSLKVRIVEVQRSVVKQLGFNLSAVLNQAGQPQYSLGINPSFGINGSLLGGITGGYNLDTTNVPLAAAPTACTSSVEMDRTNPANCLGVGRAGSTGLNKAAGTLQAFERVGLVRTLAEPTLTAVSGESARFLAGGEYPVPTGQDNTGKVTVEFKPYGVGLGFTPVVLSSGRISMKVSTEVSELTNQGSFTMQGTEGSAPLTISALKVRRAESTVELPSGGSLMMAGLLQETANQNLDSLPGMMNMPVLGALFRSRDYLSGQTELVVIVTPYIVDPTAPQDLQTPADGLRIASDAETVLLGRLNKAVKTPPQAIAGRTYQGPFGYVIE